VRIGTSPWNSFGDRPLAVLGHPYFLARSGLRLSISVASSELPNGPLLDVGCGTLPYRRFFAQHEPYECLEIDQPRNRGKSHVTHLYDGHAFGLPSDHYAVVFSSQTLEHSFFPEEMLSEAFRVLRPGGRLLLAMPFFWPEHEQPYDSQRFTSFGLRARLESAGFEVLRVTKTNPGLSCLIQLLIEAVERPMRSVLVQIPKKRTRKLTTRVLRMLLALPYTVLNLLGMSLRGLSRDTSDVEMYLDLVVVAVKPEESGSVTRWMA
jgi:SAM-dependent methyltransferase